jgi:hypothetical protein
MKIPTILTGFTLLTYGFAAEPMTRAPHSANDFLKVPEMYFVTWDAKQAVFPQEKISGEMRKRINSVRWSKGQHHLPAQLEGWFLDLNKDGVDEAIIETGQAAGDHLVLRIEGERAEIIGTFRGSFGLIRRQEGWDDIVEFSSGDSYYRAKTGLRFDGRSYKTIWRYEQTEEHSEPKMIEQAASLNGP